jgi:hypothetical protein
VLDLVTESHVVLLKVDIWQKLACPKGPYPFSTLTIIAGLSSTSSLL